MRSILDMNLLMEGFRRTWHYQRVLWFMYAMNLVLARLAALPITYKLEGVTDNSVQAHRLSDIFDYGSFSALSSNPQVKLFESSGMALPLSAVFFVVTLFLTGGILEAYRSGRTLTTREFFEACGAYFWRWVRLTLLLGIVLVPVVILIGSSVGMISFSVLNAAHERAATWTMLGGAIVFGTLLMLIRLWFDMAQVRTVVEEEFGMVQTLINAFRLTFGSLRSLFSMYAVLSLLGWLAFAVGIYVWTKMPPSRFWWTFLILEFVLFFRFGVRLWQRACEMIWYQRRFLSSLSLPTPATQTPPSLLAIAPASSPQA